jgi:hypothetical protein
VVCAVADPVHPKRISGWRIGTEYQNKTVTISYYLAASDAFSNFETNELIGPNTHRDINPAGSSKSLFFAARSSGRA